MEIKRHNPLKSHPLQERLLTQPALQQTLRQKHRWKPLPVPSTDTSVVNDDTVSSTTAGQVDISAVPSADNPAVGNTIEVAINIAGASNVAGYEIKLIL